MTAKRRIAALLGMAGYPIWADIEITLQAVIEDAERAHRDHREMATFLQSVQMLSYEQGVADLLTDVEIAIRVRAADLPIPVLAHLALLAQHWRDCPGSSAA